MTDSRKLLLSPLFLLSLFLLLINDFFLKDYFHNFLTGKLSDFAGLFAFALFWTAFFPKWKTLIFSLVVVFFTFWKSPFSSGFIDVWNSTGLFAIDRTIDFTDLAAFSILPLAWIYSEKNEPISLPIFSQNFALTAIALVSVFAFTATSKPREDEESYRYLEYKDSYTIEKPKIEVLKKLQEVQSEEFSESKSGNKDALIVGLSFRENFCENKPSVSFDVAGDGNSSRINLKSISYKCKEADLQNPDKLKAIFEKEVIAFLKN